MSLFRSLLSGLYWTQNEVNAQKNIIMHSVPEGFIDMKHKACRAYDTRISSRLIGMDRVWLQNDCAFDAISVVGKQRVWPEQFVNVLKYLIAAPHNSYFETQ